MSLHFSPFHDPQTMHHTLQRTQTQPSSFIIGLYPSITWLVYKNLSSHWSMKMCPPYSNRNFLPLRLKFATEVIWLWGCVRGCMNAWMPMRTWTVIANPCLFSAGFFFPCAIAIVYIDYTESQRMAQIKATMWRFWEFLSVGSPVEASEDTLAVCLCFESNFKYVKLCSNSTLKWL